MRRTYRQRFIDIALTSAAVTTGILFAAYHMIAWYGRVGGLFS